MNESYNPEPEEEDLDICPQCGAPTDDGEGWDGLSGNCADRAAIESGEA